MDLKADWAKRSWWLNLVLLFCLFMTFLYSPFDVVLKPLAEDEDVWLGYMFTGWAAKAGGVVHWVVYGALAWGLWFMRPWAWWLGSLYSTQVAIAMFLWPLFHAQSSWVGALTAGALFAIPAIAFWRSRDQFSPKGSTTAAAAFGDAKSADAEAAAAD
ncbi:MAG: hypothetical protein AAGE43_04760 [Pseudomonadota bacterium]